MSVVFHLAMPDMLPFPAAKSPILSGQSEYGNGMSVRYVGLERRETFAGSIHGPRSQPLSLRANLCREADLAGRHAKPRAHQPGAAAFSGVLRPLDSRVGVAA